MAKPPGLRQRGGSWEMRVRVPDRLRTIIGQREVIKSFGGVSIREARRLGWAERAAIERRFEEAEVQLGLGDAILGPEQPQRPQLTSARIAEAAKRFLHDLEASAPKVPIGDDEQLDMRNSVDEEAVFLGQQHVLTDATLQSVANSAAAAIGLRLPEGPEKFDFYAAVRDAWLEHLQRQSARLQGNPNPSFNPAFVGVDALHGGENAGLTLSEAVEQYITTPERSTNSASTQKMDRSRLGAMRDILGGDRAVSSISKADMRRYLELLVNLPAHYTMRFPGMTPQEAIAEGEKREAPKLSPRSIKRDVQAVRSFFGWLEKQDYITKNPALHLRGPKVSKKSRRRPFTAAEMRDLLMATADKGKWTYWCARIAMLQGLRLAEPLGLQVRDVEQQDGIWVIRIRKNDIRPLKTEETGRDVPLHPRLIELGILDLLEDRQPEDLLIPDIPRGDGKSFNAAQKRLARILRSHVSKDPDLTFHSLRHSFRDAMRDGGFPRGIEEKLGGWKATSGDAMEGYGRGHRMSVLRDWISKISYDGVIID